MKIPRWLLVVIVVIGIVVGLVAMPIMQSDQWSIAEANEHLGAAIPTDAYPINVGRHKGVNPILAVTFYAPPESADQYVRRLCGGKLYQRYDPFNATDVDMPSRHAYPITLYGHTVYSFSTLATDDDWGNRCKAPDGIGYIQVLSDRRDATFYHVVAELFFSCDGCTATPG